MLTAGVLCFLTQSPTVFPGPHKRTGLCLFKKKMFCKPGLIYGTFFVAGRLGVVVQAVLSGNHSSKCPDPNTHVVIVPVLCVGLGHPT